MRICRSSVSSKADSAIAFEDVEQSLAHKEPVALGRASMDQPLLETYGYFVCNI